MTSTSGGPSVGAVLFEIVWLGVFLTAIVVAYRRWGRGPDLPNSIRYGAVALGLVCIGVVVWTLTAANFGGNPVGFWLGAAAFVLAACFAIAKRVFVLVEDREINRGRRERDLSGRRPSLRLFIAEWVAYVVFLPGGFVVLGVAFWYGDRTVESGFDQGSSQALVAWIAAMLVAGGVMYLLQRQAWRREAARLRAEELGKPWPELWLAPVWAVAVLWIALTAAFCLVAGAAMVIAGHAASDTRQWAGLDGFGDVVVALVAVASVVGAVVHCRWQARRRRPKSGGRAPRGG